MNLLVFLTVKRNIFEIIDISEVVLKLIKQSITFRSRLTILIVERFLEWE